MENRKSKRKNKAALSAQQSIPYVAMHPDGVCQLPGGLYTNLHRLGVPSSSLDGRERLALLHGQMHPGRREPFRFSWADISRTGMGTKDFMARGGMDAGGCPAYLADAL